MGQIFDIETDESRTVFEVTIREPGSDGKDFTFEDFTPEQLERLQGEKGDSFKYEDFTAEQIAALKGDKGDKGDPFEFNDLTPEQKAELKGDKGDKGDPNTLTIGTVQGGANAGATITGTSPNQTLNLTLPKGDTGSNIELQKTTTHVQWRVVGGTWANLIPLSDLKGEQGDNISLQKTTTHIQWRLGTGAWINLVALTELKGDKGDSGIGVPIGGTTGQQLMKKSNVDYDFEWQTPAGAGDMLKSVYDPTGKNADVFGYVDNKVKTDVPVDAKFTDTTYENATTSVSGLMSNTDKSKLDGVEAGANKYVHPAGTNPHGTTKADVGLGNVDNVKQIPYSEKGANNGVAELDSTGKVLSSQLPSYVDDVLEYATSTNFPTTGEAGKIYIAINTNLTYRWSGTAYTEISPSIALGETSATAYRGDRGKIAYDHSQVSHAPSNAQKNSDITKAEIEAKLTGAITSHTHAYASTSHTHNASDINAGTLAIARIPTGTTSSTVALGNHTHSDYVPTSRTVAGKALSANITLAKGDVGLGNVDNTSDANKPVSTAQQTALNAKIDSNKFQVVAELPASPVSGTFYFVKE